MNRLQASTVAVALLIANCSYVQAAEPTFKPVTVGVLRVLEKAKSREIEKGWASIAYEIFQSGLFDGIMWLEASSDTGVKPSISFCFPESMKSDSMENLYSRLSGELAIATKNASDDAMVSLLLMSHLKSVYPCD